jgi:hypothetical protein
VEYDDGDCEHICLDRERVRFLGPLPAAAKPPPSPASQVEVGVAEAPAVKESRPATVGAGAGDVEPSSSSLAAAPAEPQAASGRHIRVKQEVPAAATAAAAVAATPAAKRRRLGVAESSKQRAAMPPIHAPQTAAAGPTSAFDGLAGAEEGQGTGASSRAAGEQISCEAVLGLLGCKDAKQAQQKIVSMARGQLQVDMAGAGSGNWQGATQGSICAWFMHMWVPG